MTLRRKRPRAGGKEEEMAASRVNVCPGSEAISAFPSEMPWINSLQTFHSLLLMLPIDVVFNCSIFSPFILMMVKIRALECFSLTSQSLFSGVCQHQGCLENLKHSHQKVMTFLVAKNPPANAGDTGSMPDPGRSHGPQSN